MEEEKISPLQTVAILVGFFLGTSIVMNAAAGSGPDAWFSGLVTIAGALAVTSITASLAALHPGKSLVEILIFCFGRTAGRIIGVGYLLFAVWLSGAVTFTFSYYNITVGYPETPAIFISICYILVIAFVVKMGLEVMGRISEVLIVVIMLVSLVTLFSFFTNFQPSAFLPLFKDGVAKPAVSGLKGSLLPFAEVFLALNILPNLNEPKKTFRVVWQAVLLAGGILLFFIFRNISVLGIDMAARNVYLSEKVFRLIPGLDITPLLEINVIISGVTKVSLALYSEVRIVGDLFGLKNFKILVLPFAALDTAFSVMAFGSLFDQLFIVNYIIPVAYIPILVIVPLIMFGISLIKKDKPGTAPPDPGKQVTD